MIRIFSRQGKAAPAHLGGPTRRGGFVTEDAASGRWTRRPIPSDLAERYRREGYWTDTSMGSMVETGLSTLSGTAFTVHSKVRPWSGTFADVDAAARRLAGALAKRGVGPGDVVAFQLPNWVEAGITFWAASYLGAVVVPIVHFYGRKEVDYILRSTQPKVVITCERFGHIEHAAFYEELVVEHDVPLWLLVGDTPPSQIPSRAVHFASQLDGAPIAGPLPVDPDSACVIAFTSGTTKDPKGVVHSHNTFAFEGRQLDHMFPKGGPPQITGAPVGHFIGMLNAFLVPLLRDRPVNLVDVWDPTEVLRLMLAHGIGMGGGATFFLTSLINHPDFTDEHLALMPYAGLGGSTVPVAVTERADAMGITVFRSYGSTEHPSITGSMVDDPKDKRLRTDGRLLPGAEIRLDDEGEISSRGPDCCIGYSDPELTAQMFDDEGWYRTGDVGVLDEDGYLTITDRVSDIIIRGGENISAQEIEEQLLRLDAVADAAVISAPDERLGEHAAAVLLVREGMALPSLDDIRAHLTAVGLARQKWPESLYQVTEFPRTPSGKIQKFLLRQQVRDGRLTPVEGR
jgi:acyl-CoA synthetase